MDSLDVNQRLDAIESDLEWLMSGVKRLTGIRYKEILVSGTEAARLLDVTPATITRYLHIGKLDKVTIGGSTGIRLSQIMAL